MQAEHLLRHTKEINRTTGAISKSQGMSLSLI